MLEQDQKNLVAEIENTQSETTPKLLDPKLLGAFLNSVPQVSTSQQEGRVTSVVAKARYHKVTESQFPQRYEHSAGSHQSNSVTKILQDSGSDGDLMFHVKGTSTHFSYSKRQAPTSWHTSNGNFLTKGRSEVNINFFDYSDSKEYLVTSDIVQYDKK